MSWFLSSFQSFMVLTVAKGVIVGHLFISLAVFFLFRGGQMSCCPAACTTVPTLGWAVSVVRKAPHSLIVYWTKQSYYKYVINVVYFCCIALLDGTSNGSDSKKLRVEERVGEAPPSRVLHIRKLPSEVSETEIIALGLPFGKVTNILTLKGKNQVSFWAPFVIID